MKLLERSREDEISNAYAYGYLLLNYYIANYNKN